MATDTFYLGGSHKPEVFTKSSEKDRDYAVLLLYGDQVVPIERHDALC
jgi:hypothetical protein